jgi:hypothetical protein
VDSSPYGISYAEWTARWWQWILSIPKQTNPVYDKTGNNFIVNETHPVCFLPGSIDVAVRNCTIPEGKAILLPTINYGATLADEPKIKSEFELQMLAKREIDVVSDLQVNIDGTNLDKLEICRVRSSAFDVVLPQNNLFNGIPGKTKGTGDGYWLFLKPLSRGKHKISSFGSCLAGRVKISLNLEIEIIDNCF